MKVLRGWMKWFEERGIPAVMAEKPPYGWAVYCNGLADTGKNDGN